jgi:hypothetical protein
MITFLSKILITLVLTALIAVVSTFIYTLIRIILDAVK